MTSPREPPESSILNLQTQGPRPGPWTVFLVGGGRWARVAQSVAEFGCGCFLYKTHFLFALFVPGGTQDGSKLSL